MFLAISPRRVSNKRKDPDREIGPTKEQRQRPFSSRGVAARRASWDVANPGATLAPAVAHATDSAVQHQRAASVGDDPRLCASRIRAHDDHSAAEAPEAVPPLLSSFDAESLPCGDS